MDELLVERSAGVLAITLNRPRVKNAINQSMMAALADLFRGLTDDSETRAVLIQASGPDFSAGGDIKEIAPVLREPPERRAAMLRSTVAEKSHPMFIAMHRIAQPVLMSARGRVIGAAVQMAAVADLVLASDTVSFSIPQVQLAHTVDHGESYHLVRKVGMSRAAQLCLLGERLEAERAERYGLVNWIVPDAELDGRAQQLARQMADSPPEALRGMKALLRSSPANSLEAQFAAEQDMIGRCVATEDFIEAISAFAEKRKPTFKGC